MAEHLTPHPEIEGSNSTPCTGREKITIKCLKYLFVGIIFKPEYSHIRPIGMNT